MTRDELWLLARAHADLNPGMLPLVGRVCGYAAIQCLTLWLAGAYYGDTYAANISLFLLFACSFELAVSHAVPRPRIWWYLLCVAGLVLAGVALVRHATLLAVR